MGFGSLEVVAEGGFRVSQAMEKYLSTLSQKAGGLATGTVTTLVSVVYN
jgi:hypothetical protein